MPTLDGSGVDDPRGEHPGAAYEPAQSDGALLATVHGGVAPLSERFRRAKLRQQMFGDAGEALEIGRYRIRGKIGAGAMGTVYRAVDASLDREVALKVLHRRDATHRARMQIEAKALAKLSHPNVVTVHEVDTADDQLYVAMEYVPGKTLDRWLEHGASQDVLDVFVQAASGLHAAHEAGVVHRDFKPENIIVGNDGRVRVLDFGLARSPGAVLTDEVEGADLVNDAREPAITRTGMLAGTPCYMAPEQFMGSRVDARADQFAFCIVLHEAVWGTRPFVGDNLADLAKSVGEGQSMLFGPSPRVTLPPAELDAVKQVIERGLCTDPQQRFPSMQEIAALLRPLPAIAARPTPRPRFAIVAAAVGVAALAIAGLGALAAGGLVSPSETSSAIETPSTPVATATATAPTRRCGLGTFEKGGACHPVVLDPSGLHCADGAPCQLDRALLAAHDGSAPLLATQGRLVPAVRDGKSVGLKVFGVREHSVPQRLGFQTGDIIQRVNGLKVVGQREKIATMLTRDLARTDQLEIELLRGDQAKTIKVLLVERTAK